MNPVFSICHTSARPEKWRAVYHDWMSKAVHPEQIEYVLCVDPRWGFSLDPDHYELPNLVVVQNTGRRCYVDGVNIAAKASSGSILIVNADDQFPCDGWDDLLLGLAHNPGESWVLEVSTGTPSESARKIMVCPVLSRKRYEDLGPEVFYHGYESMGADNDFCEHARLDGVVIDATHLLFPHKHPMFDERGWKFEDWNKVLDEAYKAQNSQEAMELGVKLLARRRAAGFKLLSAKRSIAMCFPGDDFRGAMVDSLLAIYAHLVELDFEVLKIRAFDTIVYGTREEIRREVMNSSPRPELILWMDHDNPLHPDQLNLLLSDLDANPEVDGVSGWCWIYNKDKKGFMVSCGNWAPNHLQWNPFPATFTREINPRLFECGGFPCFLMRLSALEKAGDSPFLPILDNQCEFGLVGDDFVFFKRAEEGGAKFLVDPRVHVPHLKYVSVEPVLPEEGAAPPVRIACMMRVKNEGRWLGRVLAAARTLCGDDVWVMEDGSTDDTAAIIQASSAHYLPSPFAGLGFDEVRDKNWLLQQVKAAGEWDWIFMPDGDEELELGGAEKIRLVLESNPNVDCFRMRIVNLWDSVETARFDGSYGRMGRESLFRASSDMSFTSFYQGEGENANHCGLHCSNAPGLGKARFAPLQVSLLHYGALHREDRIRKYKWITALDPRNEREDFYRHMVQGDLPEVAAADAVLLHGGPLKVQRLPAHLIPKFDVVPGPLVPLEAACSAAD